MSFGAVKCNVVAVHRGHLAESKDVVLASGELVNSLSLVGFYKYLGIFLRQIPSSINI